MNRTIHLFLFALALILGAGCATTTGKPKAEFRMGQTTAAPARSGSAGQPARPVAAGTERGQASWYGDKYKGRPTASGEPFDPSDLTAAHPKLPFGTRVKVTCTATGKSVVVRINDRFGGHRGRVIDLSEAAFKQIAPTARGVTEVTVEPLGN